MAMSKGKRPAHRPSRRDEVTSAAIALFAERPPSDVTIADIARHAGMTSAAVYYHFPTKDDVLIEGMRQVGEALVELIAQNTRSRAHEDVIGVVVFGFLDWLDASPLGARMYFVSSLGSSPASEALRRDMQNRLTPLIARAVRRSKGDSTKAESLVGGIALLSLLETAAVVRLSQSEIYSHLGPVAFREEIRELARRICA